MDQWSTNLFDGRWAGDTEQEAPGNWAPVTPAQPTTTKKATSMYGLMAPPYMSGESLDKAMTKALAQAVGEISLDKAHGVSLDKAHGISLDKVPGRGEQLVLQSWLEPALQPVW